MASAVLDIAQRGRVDFELQEVAALSGVHRSTISRRWPDRGALLSEALALHVSRVAIELSGEWRHDLYRIARGMRDFLCDPVELAMNRLLVRNANELFQSRMMEQWRSTIARFEQPIRDAKARGELDPSVDAEMIVAMLLATIFYEIVFAQSTPSDAQLERIVGQLVRGCLSAQNLA